jgi:hypothetical protein
MGVICEQKMQLNLVIMSLMSVVITEEYNVMVNNEELTGATEH